MVETSDQAVHTASVCQSEDIVTVRETSDHTVRTESGFYGNCFGIFCCFSRNWAISNETSNPRSLYVYMSLHLQWITTMFNFQSMYCTHNACICQFCALGCIMWHSVCPIVLMFRGRLTTLRTLGFTPFTGPYCHCSFMQLWK